jgi:hypothetical protein
VTLPLSWSHAVVVVVVVARSSVVVVVDVVVDVVVAVETLRTTLDLTPLSNVYSNGVTA